MDNLAIKRFIKMLADRTNEFLTDKKNEQISETDTSILSMLELAIQKKSGIHVIFQNKSFTGDIVKYDKNRQQLIVKNFNKNMSIIIRIPEIQRVRLVPKTVQEAQKINQKIR